MRPTRLSLKNEAQSFKGKRTTISLLVSLLEPRLRTDADVGTRAIDSKFMMLLSLPTQDIAAFLAPEHHEYAKRAADFANTKLSGAHVDDDHTARAQSRGIVQAIGKSGLLEMLAPLDLRKLCLLREAVAWKSSLADALTALQGLGSMPILLAGSDAQRAWASKAQKGEAIAGFAMTEQNAGSDVANMACRAIWD